jgi:channel protein (hemolysin III family)
VDPVSSTVPLLGFAEPMASWLHLAGAALAARSIRPLCRLGADRSARVALAVFGLGAVLALVMSGAYHALALDGPARAVLHRLDHAAIWVLIAATFTPVHAILFRGLSRWGMLGFVWACACAGVVLKTIFFARFPPGLGLALYLGLGWMGALSGAMLARRHGGRAALGLLLGGLAYSLGGAASVLHAPVLMPGYVGHHELFHVAVLAGLLAHWRFMQSVVRLAALDAQASDAQASDMSVFHPHAAVRILAPPRGPC